MGDMGGMRFLISYTWPKATIFLKDVLKSKPALFSWFSEFSGFSGFSGFSEFSGFSGFSEFRVFALMKYKKSP